MSKKKNDLACLLNGTLDIVADLMTAADAVSDALRKIPPLIGTVRAVFDIPDEPGPSEDKEAEKPKKAAAKKKEAEPEQEPPAEEITYTKSDVRKLLAGVAEHHRDEVKALLAKYGADNLTQLDEKHYAAIVADAEAITNA